jgi:hypothetical protein
MCWYCHNTKILQRIFMVTCAVEYECTHSYFVLQNCPIFFNWECTVLFQNGIKLKM